MIYLNGVKFQVSVQAAFYIEHKMVRRLVTVISLPSHQCVRMHVSIICLLSLHRLLCHSPPPSLNAVIILHYTFVTLLLLAYCKRFKNDMYFFLKVIITQQSLFNSTRAHDVHLP